MRAKTIGGEGSSRAEPEPVVLKFVPESQIVSSLTGPQSLTLSSVSNCCSTTHVPLTRLSFLFDPNQRKDKATRSGPATEARTAAVDCNGRDIYSRPGRLRNGRRDRVRAGGRRLDGNRRRQRRDKAAPVSWMRKPATAEAQRFDEASRKRSPSPETSASESWPAQ